MNVNGSAHKLGILGIENCDITRWDLPDKYPGLVFAHPENASYSMAYEAKTYIERMRGEGCEFIIVSYHGGPGSADMQLAFGVNSTNQGKRIVAENDEIDLLVLGHDHVSTYSNTYLYDSAGQGVLTVNGGGQQLTKSVFRFFETETGALDWELIESKNHQIGSFRTDENLKIKMEPYAALAEEIVSQPVGTAAGAWDKSKQFYTRQTNSMDLISAAVMEEAALGLKRKFGASGAEALASAGLDHIDVDMMIGSISSASYVIYPGSLSVKDMYRLYKYENNVLVIPMYGRDIREIMEENAEKRLIARVLDGKAYIYSYGDRFTNLIFGGLNFTYDLSAPTGQRVRIGGFSNGRAFEEDKLYLVAVNNYVLGNTNCGLRVFGEEDAIWSQTEDEAGGNIHDMLISYIRRHTEQDGAVTPEAFTWHWEAVYAASDMEPDYSNVDSAASWAKTLSDGCAYVIYQESEARALTSAEKNGSIRAEYCKAFGEKLLSPLGDAVAAYTVHMNDDGSFALTEETGRYLTCLEKGGLKLTDDVSQDGLSFWYLEEAYGGWYIMNKGAGRQALEYYSGAFSTYYLSNGDYYIFNFYSKD
ncbi:MAG: bifunctional metallophosphatase/5'-nucleotidase [Clostridia bacterium]|nr:bifunctional metallophosphatase/5'-nucleotidase [Clostridia bacterium]